MTAAASKAFRSVPPGLAERLDGAAQLFADRGLDATRIDEVARVTGVPRATLYYYFPGKEHILAHLLSRTLGEMATRLQEVHGQGGTGRQRLERLVREHLGFITSNGATYRLLVAELGKAASLVDIAAGVDRAVLEPLRSALRVGAADGSLRVDDVAAAASVVYGAVLVTGVQQLLAPDDRTCEARASAVLDVVLRGVAGV